MCVFFVKKTSGYNLVSLFLQYELVAELFSEFGEGDGAKTRVQALQSGPRGGSKQMRKTVGSQVSHRG